MDCRFCAGSLIEGSPYLTCSSCGAKSLYPMPNEEELRSYYNSAYKVPRVESEKGIAASAPITLRNLANLRIPGRKLLEIGCSYGFFLAHARKQGWDVTGIELDREAAAFGRNELLLNIHAGTLDDNQLSPPYDVIAAFHVIEHIVDPLRFLRQCKSLLSEDGILLLKTPNVGSWIAKKTGEHWSWQQTQLAHVHLFTPEALHLAATKSGFRIETIWTQRGDADNNLFERISAWGRRYRRRNETQSLAPGNLLRRRPVKFIRSITDIVYFPLSLVFDPWLAKRNLQPEIVLLARKN